MVEMWTVEGSARGPVPKSRLCAPTRKAKPGVAGTARSRAALWTRGQDVTESALRQAPLREPSQFPARGNLARPPQTRTGRSTKL